jgi:hypothetical protein
MQARVQRIGNSLIPAYQRSLPDSDPTKINFRFEVIDEKNFRDAINLPSGVILVPYQIVERMKNDDQLATLLADSIVQILEKVTLRTAGVRHGATALEIAGDATGGILTILAAHSVAGAAVNLAYAPELAQSGRVSLCLLHDAGYDIRQAPLAWWLLPDKKDKPLEQVSLPSRAENLYTTLGLAWRAPLMNASQPAPSPGLATAASAPPAASQN